MILLPMSQVRISAPFCPCSLVVVVQYTFYSWSASHSAGATRTSSVGASPKSCACSISIDCFQFRFCRGPQSLALQASRNLAHFPHIDAIVDAPRHLVVVPGICVAKTGSEPLHNGTCQCAGSASSSFSPFPLAQFCQHCRPETHIASRDAEWRRNRLEMWPGSRGVEQCRFGATHTRPTLLPFLQHPEGLLPRRSYQLQLQSQCPTWLDGYFFLDSKLEHPAAFEDGGSCVRGISTLGRVRR